MSLKYHANWLAFSIISIGAFMGFVSCSTQPAQRAFTGEPKKLLLVADWRFHRGEVADNNQAVSSSLDEASWQPVNLPHDYVLDGTYSPTKERNHGYLPVTTAWYRKHVFIPQSDQGKSLELQFDGIFRDSQVWLNGQFLCRHPSVPALPMAELLVSAEMPGALPDPAKLPLT